ncbi:MAG TPA: transposase family protein [Frankiaceae bacterium]|nr:transposase family protein [Frankiaceae bacterium]
MTGLDVAGFDALYADVVPRFFEAERQRLSRPDRRRAIGAGRRFELGPRDQVLLTVVWLRRYPINAVLGYLFGAEETTALRTVRRVLPVLEAAGLDTMRLPDPGKGRRPDLEALLRETPALAVIVDTFEQRVQRPRDRAEADTYYSGKKKQHTLKSQVAVREDGRVADVAESARGPTADITLLKDSGVLERLPPEVGALGDLAYVGIADLHPAGLGATPRRKPRGTPRPDADIASNTAFARRRIVVEHTIGRLRAYQALSQTDRHHRQGHTTRVRAVAGLVNRRLAG